MTQLAQRGPAASHRWRPSDPAPQSQATQIPPRSIATKIPLAKSCITHGFKDKIEQDSFDLIEEEIELLKREVSRLKFKRSNTHGSGKNTSAADLQRLHELNDRIVSFQGLSDTAGQPATLDAACFPVLKEHDRLPASNHGHVNSGSRTSYADALTSTVPVSQGMGLEIAQNSSQSQCSKRKIFSPTKRTAPQSQKPTINKTVAQTSGLGERPKPCSPTLATAVRSAGRHRRTSLPDSWVGVENNPSPSRHLPADGLDSRGDSANRTTPPTQRLSTNRNYPRLGGFAGATLSSTKRAGVVVVERSIARTSQPASPIAGKSEGAMTLTHSSPTRESPAAARSPFKALGSSNIYKSPRNVVKEEVAAYVDPPRHLEDYDNMRLSAFEEKLASIDDDLLRLQSQQKPTAEALEGNVSYSSLHARQSDSRGLVVKTEQQPTSCDSTTGALYNSSDSRTSKHSEDLTSTTDDSRHDSPIDNVHGCSRAASAEMDRPSSVTDIHFAKSRPPRHDNLPKALSITAEGSEGQSGRPPSETFSIPSLTTAGRTPSQATLIRTSLRGDAPAFIPTDLTSHAPIEPVQLETSPTESQPFPKLEAAPSLYEAYGFSRNNIERYWSPLEWHRLSSEEQRVITHERCLLRPNGRASATNTSSPSSRGSLWSPTVQPHRMTDPQGNVIYGNRSSYGTRRLARAVPVQLGRAPLPFTPPEQVGTWTIGSAQPGWWYGWCGGDGKEIAFTGNGPDAEKEPNSPVNFRGSHAANPVSPNHVSTTGSGFSTVLNSQSSASSSPVRNACTLHAPAVSLGSTFAPCGNYDILRAVEHIGAPGSVFGLCHTCQGHGQNRHG